MVSSEHEPIRDKEAQFELLFGNRNPSTNNNVYVMLSTTCALAELAHEQALQVTPEIHKACGVTELYHPGTKKHCC